MGMKLEVAVLPVADAERVKDFYGQFGGRLDDASFSDSGFRLVQFQPDGTSGRVSGPAPDYEGYRSFAAYIGAEQARTELPT